MLYYFKGLGPDDPCGRSGLRNPERGFRTEMYFSCIPGEIAGTCSCHSKQLKLDGRSEVPVYQNADIPGVPHLIRGNRLDGIEFSHSQWRDELEFLAYDGVTIMQSYCFLKKYDDGRDLPQEKLEDIETFFLKVRQAGAKCLLRFAYELSPTLQGPSAETILKHLAQLRPLLRKYVDVIYVLQCGFVGKFGEWHNSFHFLQNDLGFRKELIAAVLETLPQERKTMMRYPFLKQELFGTEPISEAEAFTVLPQARIGHFNDGFLAGPSHGGTFCRKSSQSLEKDFEYLTQESRFLPQDGELFWRDTNAPALPHEAAELLAKWHYDTFSMVHGNVLFEGVDGYSIDVWKRVPVDPMFLIEKNLPWTESYFRDEQGRHVWRSYYEYIRDHLGYRIELLRFEYEIKEQILSGKISLINRGFSAPVNPRKVYLALGKQRIELNTDIRKWYSRQEQILTFEVSVSGGEEYEAGLWMPDGSEILQDREEYAIRCANPLYFKNGVNWFGIKIKTN